MKQCPKCGQSYADPNLNFCLSDGELLMQAADFGRSDFPSDEPPPTMFADDDSPPTLMMDNPRTTNPIGWASSSSPVPSQGQQIITPPGHYPVQYANLSSPSQAFPIIALVLSIFSLIFVCCYGGIWLGIPAAIIGFIGMRNADLDPTKYGGRGMAIAGLIIGVITFTLSVLVLVLGLAGNLLQV